MVVKEGYKNTEVGVIPKDWKVLTIEDITITKGIVRGPFGGALKKDIFVNKGYKVYEQRNAIYKSVELGRYFIDENKYKELKRFSVNSGDFIISCSGTIGKIYEIPDNFEEGIINQALLKLTLNNDLILSDFFYYQFTDESFQAKVIDDTQGGAMKNLIGISEFKESLLSVPNLPQQTAIATVLSDTDNLIQALEKKIAKKELIKKGAMQELLEPKEGWEVKRLGEIAEFYKGNGLPKSEIIKTGKRKCIHYGELFTKYNEEIKDIISYTNKVDNCFYSKMNDVLMPTSDVTPNGLATASCILENDVILGGDILVIRISNEIIYGLYLSYYIGMHREKVLELVTGSTVYHLYGSDMAKYKIEYPNVTEQTHIAQILSDMDTEIESLQEKLSKYKQLKQGLMQELLTGKTRLI